MLAVLATPSVLSKTTTAMLTPATVWTFSQVTDSVSQLLVAADATGYTYCGTRTYALSG